MTEDITTQCWLFPELCNKLVVARFDEERGSSDGGAVLLQAIDKRIGLTARLTGALRDDRQAGKVVHHLDELVAQRVFAIACGYPDGNDSARLGDDPVHKLLVGRDPVAGEALASQPTISRFENSVSRGELYRMGETLAEVVIERQRKRLRGKARTITIDLDPTEDPTYGEQQLTFFNGFYDNWCYLPMMGFVSFDSESEQYLVASVLRPGNAPDKRGAIAILHRLLARLRPAFSKARYRVRLVLFQLDRPNRADAVEGVTGVAEAPVAVAQVAVDAATAGDVVEVVGVRESEALQNSEVGFDEIEPGRLSGCPDRGDAELSQQAAEARVVVGLVQVVHDHEETLAGVAGWQMAEGVEEIGKALALAEDPAEAVAVDVVEAEELLGALEAVIGGAAPQGHHLACPGHASYRTQLQRTPLVEANYRRAFRAAPIELPDAFFLRSKSGSSEVFQVRIRCAVSPSRRRSRRTHSSVTGGSSRRRRQYSESLGTDQLENGRPLSAGLERATSTSSRSCSALRMGGRPLGLGTCSNVLNPLLLNRRIQSYATVKWQPTRSAASATVWPLNTSPTIRYRWWTRAERDRSLSFSRKTPCSARLKARSRTVPAILPPFLEGRIAESRLNKLEHH